MLNGLLDETVYPELRSRQYNEKIAEGIQGVFYNMRSCVINEKINGEFTLKMEYPLDAPLSTIVKLDDFILAEIAPSQEGLLNNLRRSAQYFRILEIEEDWENNAMYIYAEHVTSDLNRAVTAESKVLYQQLLQAGKRPITLGTYPAGAQPLLAEKGTPTVQRFQFTTFINKLPPLNGQEYIIHFGTLGDAYFLDSNSIMSVFGGGQMRKDNHNLELREQLGLDRDDIKLRLDFNVAGFKIKRRNPVATRIYPYMKAQVHTEQNMTSPTLERVIDIRNAIPNWGNVEFIKSPNEGQYSDVVALAVEYSPPFSDDPYTALGIAKTELWAMAQNYYNTPIGKQNALPRYTYEIDFRALSEGTDWGNHLKDVYPLLPQIMLGDRVPLVLNEKTNEEVIVQCVEYEFNLMTGQYNTLKLGNIDESFTSTLAKTFNPQQQNN